jgi:hypothetical protein
LKVIVCGGRKFKSPAQVWRELDRLHSILHFTQLMQGGARGVDAFAREWAILNPEIKRWVCRAEWKRYGNAAGPIRNRRMLQWQPDLVIAFPGGNGTADMIDQAKAAGIPVHLVNINTAFALRAL